jgi:hypothetical protein
MFSSISPDYEYYLKEEIWGCMHYMGFSYETLRKMPIRDRKYFIMRHNQEIERQNAQYENTKSISGSALNEFAKSSQNIKNL